MFNFSGVSNQSIYGMVLRLPLRCIPQNLQVRILQGELRGKKWIAGSSNHGCWLGSYEFEKQQIISRAVQHGDVFFDIGANVGYYTMLASKLVGKAGRVFAFEPFPENLEYLQQHLEINGVENVTVFRSAVAENSGRGKFLREASNSMGRLDERGTISVNIVSLDDLFAQGKISLPDHIKIDVEGAEYDVLQGASRVVAKSSPTIFLATHGREVHQQCLTLLDSWGYSFYAYDGTRDVSACDELIAEKR